MGLSSAQRALRFHFIACKVGAELLNGLQKGNAKAGIYAAYTSLNPILMLWAKYLYNYGILHDRIRLLNSDPESWEMKIYGKNREQHSLFPPVRRGGDRRHRKTEDLFRVRGRRGQDLRYAGGSPSGAERRRRRGGRLCGAPRQAGYTGAAGRAGGPLMQGGGLPGDPAAGV
ncbi:Uncharacterised protein [uncultured Blautia sp.]|nr:Uncharacterised protein [uncultured Blautia sp.]